MARSITQEHGIDCRFAGAFDLEVDRATGYQLYWIAREAAANAVKHGRAQHVAIDLVQQDGTLQLSVRDDGAGLVQSNASSTKGVGLKLMAQRAR